MLDGFHLAHELLVLELPFLQRLLCGGDLVLELLCLEFSGAELLGSVAEFALDLVLFLDKERVLSGQFGVGGAVGFTFFNGALDLG